jgi:Leucine-rich repeat (LRR) protein
MCSRYARLILTTLPAIVLVGLTLLLSPRIAAAPAYDCATATGLPQVECEALVALYNTAGGESWYGHTDWLQTTTPCTWTGVTCVADKVQRLVLGGSNLIGSIPSEIGSLTSLMNLWLVGNQLTNLPPEFGNLASLTFLTLGHNQLASLPPEFGNLTNLGSLDVSNNQLTGLPPRSAI